MRRRDGQLIPISTRKLFDRYAWNNSKLYYDAGRRRDEPGGVGLSWIQVPQRVF